MRVWGARRASAKPASNPRAEPASLGPSLTCHPHYTPGAALLTGWLQARGPGRPGQGCLAGWGRASPWGGGHRVEPRDPLSIRSLSPVELMSES